MDRALPVMNSVSHSPFQLGLILCTLTLLTRGLARVMSDRRRNPSRLPLPPGPKGYPLIGNVLEMPTGFHWRTYSQWAKVYGELSLGSLTTMQ